MIHALRAGQWTVGGVLTLVGLAAVLCPVAPVAINRRSEFAADRFAADHGLARELAAALQVMDNGRRVVRGWASQLLVSHPPLEQRIDALLAARATEPVTVQRP